ncbi:MAG: NADH-quinone oxidoreductase subunit NuoK [Methanomassiliicoccaceae archaeon]|jgi:NADH-quinone oxidoreductase subunit K|nr:NADH-quinone oxidoreductase subunit NuoK [Methanomassiliicoccaceae archaeon]
MIPIELFILLSAMLFSVGLIGMLTKKNAIVILMCIEIMLNAANINFIAFAATYPAAPLAHIFVITAITVAAAEVGVGIAILLHAYKTRKTTNIDELTSLRW